MNIAIMSHTKKQELMVQFCTAYCGVLSKHSVCGTNATGRMVAEATGLPVQLFLSHEHGGIEQIGQRIIYNEIDMVLFFNSPQDNEMDKDVLYITRLCDQHSVPVATNGHEPQPGPLRAVSHGPRFALPSRFWRMGAFRFFCALPPVSLGAS